MQISKEQMKSLPIGVALRVTTRPVLQIAKPLGDYRLAATHHSYLTQDTFNAREHAYRKAQRMQRYWRKNVERAARVSFEQRAFVMN